MAGKETKQEEIARRIKHKRKKEEWRQAMQIWEALNRDPNAPIEVGYKSKPNYAAGYYYCPYIPIMTPKIITGDSTA